MNNIFMQLAIILSFSSVLGLVIYKLKLPLLIAYLLGGLLLSFAATFDLSKSLAFSFLPDIGVAFVLFLVGMELDLREIKSLGKQILTAGILQVIITSTIGAFVAQSFNFPTEDALILGIGLSFSSTLVVIKLLLDKKDLTSLHGKLSVGILLLEDLIAVMILLVLSSGAIFHPVLSNLLPLSIFLLKVVLLFLTALVTNRFILSAIFKAVSDSSELLFLTALAWCFSFITLSLVLGFSILIGAFLAGVALASSQYHFQIQGKVKPMRDFFAALFFVYLGTRVNFSHILSVYPLILIFTIFAVFIKPVIFLLLFGIFGFKKHTMFKAAINLSQVSEFSLIIMLVALKSNFISPSALTIIALSSVLSFIVSSLMISQSNLIYKKLSKLIAFFERKKPRLEAAGSTELSDHVVVIGAHRVGGEIVRFLKREKLKMVVLDYNPHQVEALLSQDIPVIFGDISDPDILDILNLTKARLIISTSAEVEANKALLSELKLKKVQSPIITRAETIKDANSLYKAGADFVIIPDILAGDYLLDILKDHLNDKSYFQQRPKIEAEKLQRKILAWG